MKKEVKYSLKILGWFVLAIVVLLLLLSLLIQTRPVKQKLAGIAAKQTTNFINGNVTMGGIEGNFFTHLQLNNLLWKFDDDTVAYIEKLGLTYDLRPLLSGKLLIHSINIEHPYFHLKQVNDSIWNIMQLIKPSESKTDTAAPASTFQLDLPSVQLIEGRINFDTADTLIPKQIQHLNTELSFNMKKSRQSFQLYQFSFVSKQPDITLSQLRFNIVRDTSIIHLSDFFLKTNQNQLNAKSTYKTLSKQGTAHFQSAPLHPGEFEFLLPQLKIPVSPELSFDARLNNDSLYATVDLAEKKQKIHLKLAIAKFADFMSNSSDFKLEYELNGKLENINLSQWTGNPQINYLINGQFLAQGKGTDPKTAKIKLQADFNDCLIENKTVDSLMFDFNLEQGDLKGIVKGSGDFGYFNLNPDFKNLFDSPTYQIELTTRQLNLAQLLGNDSLQSNINMKANISGRSFDPKLMSVSASLNVAVSYFKSLKLDTVIANVLFAENNYKVDTFCVKTHSAVINAHGNYALKSNADIILNARFDNITDFKSYIPLIALQTGGTVDAHLWGSVDSLNLVSEVNLDSTQYDALFLDKLTLRASAKANRKDTLIQANLIAFNLQNNDLLIDSVLMDIQADTDAMFFSGQVADNDIQTKLKGTMNWQQQLRITLENWIIDYKDQHLALQQSPAVFEIDSTDYKIHNFKMATNSSDTAQFISLEGNISRTGNEKLELKINNVDVASWMELLENQVNATGLASLNISVGGTATEPLVNGDFGIRNAELNKYKFTDFGGTFDFQNNRLNIQSGIVPVDSGRIQISGFVPLQVELDSLTFNFNPKDSIDFRLKVDKFPLAVVKTLNISENISGFIDGNVMVTGTAESPDPNGEIKLINAAVKMPEYGIDYHNILFNLSFLQNNIRLDTLRIKTADGDVSGNGKIDFSSKFYKGNISQSQINLKFNRFNPVNHRQFNMEVSGNASLGGEKGDVVFDGNLNIPEAEFYLPAILNMMGEFYVPEIPKPLLVQAMEQHTNMPDSFQINVQPEDTSKQFNLDYFNQLTGKLRIKIPRNTWVKNEDLRIELSGDLELIKHKTFFELFGSAKVIRGQYDMLGRTFVIDEGTISFEGGEDLIPQMNITASYTFRNAQREEKKLTVNITGTAESPDVGFTLNGSAVSEGDALSYILFGKGMNELTIDQQDNLTGAGGGQLAGKAAASILSAQISNFLSKKINVDYIEVKSDGAFDNATVVVGKYLTNDLFVSYEQRFGTTDQTDIAKYEVKLEYELFKFLFFQLNNSSNESGFDVIFKVNSK